MVLPRKISPLAQLVHTLQQEGIRFQIVGMSAAILQGVPATTLDTDQTIVRVLPIQRIIRSKEFVGRPKDLAHLPLLHQTLRLRHRLHAKDT